MKSSGIYAGGEFYDRIFRALGDPHRIQIIGLLKEKELSAGEILEAIDIVQSTLSHHMKTLSDSGAVNAVRRGKWTYYSLNEVNLEKAAAFLKMCSEGTKVRRTGMEPQNKVRSLAGVAADISGKSSAGGAEKAAEKEYGASAAGINAKAAENEAGKGAAGNTAKTAEKVSGKSVAEKASGKSAAEKAQGKNSAAGTAKNPEKEAEKSVKKKDKKGKKGKKNKK